MPSTRRCGCVSASDSRARASATCTSATRSASSAARCSRRRWTTCTTSWREPGEVVVVINQDYVTPEDFVAAVEDAELDELAYRGPTRGRWPTLRQLIDRNQRVVFLAENEAGAAPWYHLAYDAITEETPYSFSRPGS